MRSLSRSEVFAFGALGGLLPVLATLITIDLAPIIDHPMDFSIGHYVGYSIKVLALITLGGIMAILNSDVQQPLTLVQIGIAAPALISSYINSAPPKVDHTAQVHSYIIQPTRADEFVGVKPLRLAGGFFTDVLQGFTRPLASIDSGASKAPTPPSNAVPGPPAYANPGALPSDKGNFCQTAQGRFGPGLVQPLGAPCSAPVPSGELMGSVVR
jgi:hypothetical protein